MPSPDPIPRSGRRFVDVPRAEQVRRSREDILAEKILRSAKGKRPPRRKPGKGMGGEPVPVEPNRPNNLSGGAAAALEFDE